MCSVQDETESVAVPRSEIRLDDINRICMKCKENTAVVVTRVNDAFCRNCFMVYVVHKFRSSIGKSHLIRDGEKVLLAFSGGPASSALLHLVQEGLSERAHKKLRFIPSIVHIDESVVVGLTADDRKTKNEAILKILHDTGYSCYFSTLEQALDLSDQSSPCCTVTEDGTANYSGKDSLDTRLADILKTMKSMTAREDFMRNLKYQLLAAIAHRYGYKKVMFGDTSTRLAVRILSDIGQGRGAQVSSNTSFADNRYGDVMFVRPIRELTLKEVAMYNSLNKVESIFVPTLTTKACSAASINHLTESFVTGLQAEFPSTVSNITRTAGKLDTVEKSSSEDVCLLCQSPLDTDVTEATALRAVEFSEALSKRGCDEDPKVMAGCCGEGADSCQSNRSCSINKNVVYKTLCYGCRLTVKEMTDLSRLPGYVTEGAMARMSRTKMKEDIQDFLIDDDHT